MGHVAWARKLSAQLLADALPQRWSHTQGVSRKAETVANVVGDDAELLTCAAWLHDIGYAPELAVTGFHPLDGARYLRDIADADDRLCRLVANHSGAVFEARHRGHYGELIGEFPAVGGLLADALTYCDMTTSPDGDPVDVDARLDEILTRYGGGDPVAEAIQDARPEIVRSAQTILSLTRA